MLSSISNNLVRFVALMSVIAFFTGYSSGYPAMIILEIAMVLIWLQMDYQKIKNLLKMKKYK
ncbi:hypothetical protein [Enterobacter hormaechei]|uniref:hypothetical protein n=1 Tax=Enterobacter hormaechei TaxID=158836 RepID=UPI000CF84108|nr:hypothetical protein [Enterobacter hormaechei]